MGLEKMLKTKINATPFSEMGYLGNPLTNLTLYTNISTF